jgi:benzoylsuccinyl-CoA thiolase BbsB subunit
VEGKQVREVVVIGVGQSRFGKYPELSAVDLGREAVLAALKDGDVSPRDIQVAYASRLYDGSTTAQSILKEVGVRQLEMVNVENACAGGSTAFRGVWKEIANGHYDIGIAIGVESMSTSPIASKLIPPPKEDLEGQLGSTMPAVFAMIARRQMEQYGTTLEDFAQISVKNHDHGCLNPFAQYRKEFTVEEILKSRVICDPITLLMCCPNTDGAAAAVLCSADIARRYTTKLIRVIGSSLLSGDYKHLQDDITISPLGRSAARKAYEMAGCGPEDVDLVELHDAFAPEEILRYEDLGL